MTIALIIVAAFLGVAATISAIGKLTKKPDVISTMTHVGVPAQSIPLLAGLELLGVVGLIVGIWSKPIGIAAAAGLALYFLGAVLAHVRAKDQVKDLAPASLLFVVSVATFVLELAR